MFNKLKMIWYIIRGRTVAYKVRLEDGTIVIREPEKAIVQECTITGSSGIITEKVGIDTLKNIPMPKIIRLINKE